MHRWFPPSVKPCSHEQLFQATFLADTVFGGLCLRNPPAFGIFHTQKRLRGRTLVGSHTIKNRPSSIDNIFDLVSAGMLAEKVAPVNVA